tara:strand:- start:1182 stop:1604 length:423 start_codon:yes stop_codon:yes gene_type:complete
LADLNVQQCVTAQAMGVADEGGIQGEAEILNDAESFEFTVECSHVQRTLVGMDLKRHHRFHLQLKHLKAGHGVAVGAGTQFCELAGIQQSSDNTFLLLEISRQMLLVAINREIEALTGTEGQRHDHLPTRHDPIQCPKCL